MSNEQNQSDAKAHPVDTVVMCKNPHWVNKLPAWDITLSNGVEHKDVTRVEISKALGELYRKGVISLYDSYIDVVRDCHIKWYNTFHTT